MSVFKSPGLADQGVNTAALSAWNSSIQDIFDGCGVSPFLVMDPRDIELGQPARGFRWLANPREPRDCLGDELAARLSDQGWSSRAELHNEYLEYTLVMRPDASGRMRPKRFVATTEFMEWWRTMAVFDLDHFLSVVATVSGSFYSCEDLFEASQSEWNLMEVSQRMARFHKRLVGRNHVQPPEHPLNIQHVLFMANKANSLIDLIHTMHLSSFPYLVTSGENRRRARLGEVLDFAYRQDLYCQHAGTRLAKETLDLAFGKGGASPTGRAMAFSDPLVLYIQAFHESDLFAGENNVPLDWVRYARGAPGMPMRLEFGPADDDPWFLDEITLGSGASARPVSGYTLASLIEVGPLITVAAKPRAITRVEFVEIPDVDPARFVCGLPETQRCRQISEFADQCEAEAEGDSTPFRENKN
ncbi:hypothetical protein [uncultured Ruegeria sp.]|uniref:hypothetical protein n=1 Tax=uncultured Ruegeria sp. TaxID=259304 RepID=UPI00261F81FD|nr:hypothetical protein [uncultured Ruegeria sp.]